MAGEDALHEGHGPLFEGFGQDGVVGVAGAGADVGPGVIPGETFDVHEDAHELGDDEGGVGVVELDEDVLGEVAPFVAFLAEATEDVVDGGGDEEVLLAEAELFAGGGGVVGVEDLGEVLGEDLALDGLDVVAAVEFIEGEFVGGLGAPEAEGGDGLALVADDGEVVGDGLDLLGGDPDPFVAAGAAGVVLDVSAEADEAGVFGALDFPGVAVLQPVVGLFALFAVDDALAEDAVVVAQAVAGGGEVEGGEGIHEAGGEAAEAAVAEAGVHLVVAEAVPVQAEGVHGFAALLLEAEVDDVVAEEAADEELEGEVVDAADLGGAVGVLGGHPAVDDAVAHGIGEGFVAIAFGGSVAALGEGETHVPEEVLGEALGGELSGGVVAGQDDLFGGFVLGLGGRAHGESPWGDEGG